MSNTPNQTSYIDPDSVMVKDSKQIRELNPDLRIIIEQASEILFASGLFHELSFSENENDTVSYYAVPRWIFEDMIAEGLTKEDFVYTLRLPKNGERLTHPEILRKVKEISISLMQSYVKGGRVMVLDNDLNPQAVEVE